MASYALGAGIPDVPLAVNLNSPLPAPTPACVNTWAILSGEMTPSMWMVV
jgi:hypothetical protein